MTTVQTVSDQLSLLWKENRVLELGLKASLAKSFTKVRFVGDEKVWVEGYENTLLKEEPRLRVFLTVKELVQTSTQEGIQDHLALPLEGWQEALEHQDRLAGFTLFAGSVKEGFQLPQELSQLEIPLSLAFTYSPQTSFSQLESFLLTLQESKVERVIPLPVSVGDKILIKNVTTDGDLDMRVLALTRLLLPQKIVKSSWAAFGWKLGLIASAFGADELGGWSGEESLAYQPRLRPADRVLTKEVLQGIQEMGKESVDLA